MILHNHHGAVRGLIPRQKGVGHVHSDGDIGEGEVAFAVGGRGEAVAGAVSDQNYGCAYGWAAVLSEQMYATVDRTDLREGEGGSQGQGKDKPDCAVLKHRDSSGEIS